MALLNVKMLSCAAPGDCPLRSISSQLTDSRPFLSVNALFEDSVTLPLLDGLIRYASEIFLIEKIKVSLDAIG